MTTDEEIRQAWEHARYPFVKCEHLPLEPGYAVCNHLCHEKTGVPVLIESPTKSKLGVIECKERIHSMPDDFDVVCAHHVRQDYPQLFN